MKYVYALVFLMLLTNFEYVAIVDLVKVLIFVLLFWMIFNYSASLKKLFKGLVMGNKGYFYAFVFALALSFLRTNDYEVGGYYGVQKCLRFFLFLAATFIYFYYKVYKSKKRINENTYLEIFSIPAYFLIISLILYVFSVDPLNNNANDIKYQSSLIAKSLLGLTLERRSSALAVGINGYGLFVGSVLTMSLTALWSFKKRKARIRIGLISLVALINLIYVDTRSALLWSFLAAFIAILLFAVKRIQYAKFLTVFMGVIFPVVLLAASFLLQSDALSGLARGDNDIATGNSRLTIWLSCWNELSSFKLIHIIGYGEFGQTGSGVSKNYTQVFADVKNADLLSTHNTVFQTILDTGYIGLLLFFGFLWNLISRIKNAYKLSGDKNLAMFISFILYTVLVGGTEANLTHKLSFHMIWFIFVGVMVIEAYYKKLKAEENELINNQNTIQDTQPELLKP